MTSHKTILRLNQVLQRTGISRSSVNRFIKAGTFPKPIMLGVRSIGWYDQDIDSWVENRQPTSNVTGFENNTGDCK